MPDYRVRWKNGNDLKNTYGSESMSLDEAYEYRDALAPESSVASVWIEQARWELFIEED